jgi:hypothetical protein
MRWLLVVPLALGVVTRSHAAEEAAAPAPTAAAGRSISEAKRDFDSIKASREEALHPKADLPRMTVPELQLATPSPRPSVDRDAETDPRKKAKSANWLVDAMEKDDKKSGARSRSGKSNSGKDTEPAEAWDAEKSSSQLDLTKVPENRREAAAGEAKDRREVEPPPNPLAPFLAGWMTAQDYALLKPTVTSGSAATAANPVALPGAAAAASGAMLALSSDVRTPFRGDGPSAIKPAPAENPYLSALNEPAPSYGAISVPPPPATLPATPAPAPARYEPPVAPPPAKLPDFARPANDDRYFKPLKRF